MVLVLAAGLATATSSLSDVTVALLLPFVVTVLDFVGSTGRSFSFPTSSIEESSTGDGVLDGARLTGARFLAVVTEPA